MICLDFICLDFICLDFICLDFICLDCIGSVNSIGAYSLGAFVKRFLLLALIL